MTNTCSQLTVNSGWREIFGDLQKKSPQEWRLMRDRYFSILKKHYPQLPETSKDLISENLLSPFHIQLPKSILDQGQRIVHELYSLRENSEYQQQTLSKVPEIARFDPLNKSICMSYDFHLNNNNELKLIEVNTNAAFLLLGHHLYELHEIQQPISDFTTDEIIENISEECQLAGKPTPQTIVITDNTPEQQRLYIEFLAFQNLLNKNGLRTEIRDLQNITDTPDFIYNRSTDFYFEDTRSQGLKSWYLNRKSVVSPNPHEYSLLADKQRLVEWTRLNSFNQIKNIENYLLKSELVNSDSIEMLWPKRKTLFFKPTHSYGSKMSYRGESISRKLLEQLVQEEEIMVQEYCPPPTSKFKVENEEIELKYDLRFFAYKNRVQMVIARLYQGQVTNLKARYGGFACVEFI